MIVLRELKEKDAPFMLEWMQDADIQRSFKRRMADSTIGDVLKFIEKASSVDAVSTGTDLHYAIADQADDQYLGTVSLKNIDLENGHAEFAIVTRKKAHDKGIGHEATILMLKKAFNEIGLQRVYLNVFSNNASAIKLYERCGFRPEGEFRNHFLIDGQYVGWKLYGMLKDEFDETR